MEPEFVDVYPSDVIKLHGAAEVEEGLNKLMREVVTKERSFG